MAVTCEYAGISTVGKEFLGRRFYTVEPCGDHWSLPRNEYATKCACCGSVNK